MNTETVSRIEQQISQIERDRAKAIDANDAAIQAEENRKTGHTDIQAAKAQQLNAKKDSVVSAFDKILERKAVELATARTQMTIREADERSANEARLTKQKEIAQRAYLAAGGDPSGFEIYWQQSNVTQTVAKMREEKNRVVLPRI